MGLLIDEEKLNYTTIHEIKYEYKGYQVVVTLSEYDQYSRVLMFTETAKFESIFVIAYRNKDEKHISFKDESDTITYTSVSWKQEDGPSVSLQFQIQKVIDEIEQELDHWKERSNEFATHVNTMRHH